MAVPPFVAKFLIFLSLTCIFTKAHLQLQSKEDGFISVSISEKGIEFLKDLLTDKAVSTLTPLELSPIEQTLHILLVGKVHIVLSNIILYHIDVPSSKIELGDDGITIVGSGATANLSMDWKYSYKNWLVEVTDNGDASVQVEDMVVGLRVDLKEQAGKLELSLLNSRCDIGHIDIKLNGGASWLYQGLVDAFTNHIMSAVQDAILKKLREGMSKIGSQLQSLPKQIEVDDTSALNVTFVDDPILSESSIGFIINGLFIPMHKSLLSRNKNQVSQTSVPCYGAAKMIAMSLHEDVFNSASLVYYHAGLMNWKIDKMPNQSILKTNLWREVVPQLYEQFPDDDLVLNLSVSIPPFLQIFDDKMKATIQADVTVDVLDDDEVIPVASLSLEMSSSGSAEISRNNLTGSIKLDNLTLSAKWSKIGDLQVDLIEPLITMIVQDILLPPLNMRLTGGFQLPLIHGFTLQDAEIVYTDSKITVCSDVVYYASDYLFPEKYRINYVFPFIWAL